MCGDDIDVVDGRPTGSVRISFGYMSTFEDAQAFVKFIIAIRLSGCNIVPLPPPAEVVPRAKSQTSTLPRKGIRGDSQLGTSSAAMPVNMQSSNGHWERGVVESSDHSLEGSPSTERPITVTNIYLYPIKSCAAFEVNDFTGILKYSYSFR